jgi:hypothetical protein
MFPYFYDSIQSPLSQFEIHTFVSLNALSISICLLTVVLVKWPGLILDLLTELKFAVYIILYKLLSLLKENSNIIFSQFVGWVIIILSGFYFPTGLYLLSMCENKIAGIILFIITWNSWICLICIIFKSLLIKHNTFLNIISGIQSFLQSPQKIQFIRENRYIIYGYIGMFLFVFCTFFLVSYYIFSFVDSNININNLEYSYCLKGYIRICSIFPALYIIHVIIEWIKFILSTVWSKLYTPNYSIDGMNYSIFNLICSVAGFIFFTTFVYPNLKEILVDYSVLNKKFRIIPIFNDNDFFKVKEYPLYNTRNIQEIKIEKPAYVEEKSSYKYENLLVKYLAFFIKDNLKLLDFDFKNNYKYWNLKSNFQGNNLQKPIYKSISRIICTEAYNKLDSYNKLILSSSKHNYMALNICNMAYYALYPESMKIVPRTSIIYVEYPDINKKLWFKDRSNLLLENKKDIFFTFNNIPNLLLESYKELPIIYGKNRYIPTFSLEYPKFELSSIYSKNSYLPSFRSNDDKYIEDIINNAVKSTQVYINNQNDYRMLPERSNTFSIISIRNKVSSPFYNRLTFFYAEHFLTMDPDNFRMFDINPGNNSLYIKIKEEPCERYLEYKGNIYHDQSLMLFIKTSATYTPHQLINANPMPKEGLPFYYKDKNLYCKYSIPVYEPTSSLNNTYRRLHIKLGDSYEEIPWKTHFSLYINSGLDSEFTGENAHNLEKWLSTNKNKNLKNLSSVKTKLYSVFYNEVLELITKYPSWEFSDSNALIFINNTQIKANNMYWIGEPKMKYISHSFSQGPLSLYNAINAKHGTYSHHIYPNIKPNFTGFSQRVKKIGFVTYDPNNPCNKEHNCNTKIYINIDLYKTRKTCIETPWKIKYVTIYNKRFSLESSIVTNMLPWPNLCAGLNETQGIFEEFKDVLSSFNKREDKLDFILEHHKVLGKYLKEIYAQLAQSIYTSEEVEAFKVARHSSLDKLGHKYDLITEELNKLRAEDLGWNKQYDEWLKVDSNFACPFANNKSIILNRVKEISYFLPKELDKNPSKISELPQDVLGEAEGNANNKGKKPAVMDTGIVATASSHLNEANLESEHKGGMDSVQPDFNLFEGEDLYGVSDNEESNSANMKGNPINNRNPEYFSNNLDNELLNYEGNSVSNLFNTNPTVSTYPLDTTLSYNNLLGVEDLYGISNNEQGNLANPSNNLLNYNNSENNWIDNTSNEFSWDIDEIDNPYTNSITAAESSNQNPDSSSNLNENNYYRY